MKLTGSFYPSLALACLLHLLLGFCLWGFSSDKPPVLQQDVKNEPGLILPLEEEARKPESIKAVSVDSQEVMKAMNQIKAKEAKKQQQEALRQETLRSAAEKARQQRIAEQKQLEQLKEEALKLTAAHKKQVAEEEARLKKLTLEKEIETKRLEELKQKQKELAKKEAEAKRLETLALKQKQEKEAAAKALLAEEEARKKQAALEKAAEQAANQARMAGEVNKYKALILNAISARWIVPEQANKNLSSQFRLRLAPDGAVLEATLTRSSGDAILDRSAETAIYKASPLPVPHDAATFSLFRDINLTVRPMNVRG